MRKRMLSICLGGTGFEMLRHERRMNSTGLLRGRGERASLTAIATVGLFVVLLAGCSSRFTPLMSAARYKDVGTVARLLKEGANPNEQNKDGWTALMLAAEYNPDPLVVEALLNSGAAVDAANSSGITPLMSAAAKNPNPDVIRVLLRAGANINARSKTGFTSLMGAAVNNTVQVARTLLGAGADLNAEDDSRRSALMYAAQFSRHPEMVVFLLESGGDASKTDRAGKSALDYVRTNLVLRDGEAQRRLQGAARK
jgi:ankyrin repeat protein